VATKTVTIPRDAGTGRIVKPEYAKTHPKTTVVERRVVTTPAKKK
jgi:hypothetical protein